MSSVIKLKRSNTPNAVPTFGVNPATDIVEGELAINLADKKLFTANSTQVFSVSGDLYDVNTTAMATVGAGANINLVCDNSAIGTDTVTLTAGQNMTVTRHANGAVELAHTGASALTAGQVQTTNIGNGVITGTKIAVDAVALGNHTTGDYVENLVQGNGIALLNNSGESAQPSISLAPTIAGLTSVTSTNFVGDLAGAVVGTTVSASAGFAGALTGNVTGTVSSITNHDTAALAEDASATTTSGTMYFTDARAQGAISHVDAGGDGSLTYAAGVITYTGPSAAEARAHFSQGTGVTYSAAAGTIAIGQDVATSSGVTFDTVVATTGFTGALTGNATTATTLATTRAIALSGDVTGTVSFDGSSDVTIAATIAPDSVALGSDTTGAYVQNAQGTTDEVTVTGGGAEGATLTIGLPSDVTVANDLTVGGNVATTGNLTVSGNLDVNGTLTYIDSTTVEIGDNMISFAANNNTSDTVDIGFYGQSYDGSAVEYHGITRSSTNGQYYVFDSLAAQPTQNIDYANDTALAQLNAVIDGGSF